MGIRVVGVTVVWSGVRWRTHSPRSRLGLPDGKKPGARAMGIRVVGVTVV